MTTRRALFLILCVLLISTGAIAGQAPVSPTVSGTEGELLKWGVTQGGLTLLCALLILSEIRRSTALASSLDKATAALATHAEAARQQATAFTHLAESVRLCEAVRQMIREEDRG